MKKHLLSFVFLIWSIHTFSQHTKVLFIGNSYTYVNDLPGTFSQLSLSLGDSVIYDSNAPGGYTFNMHSTNVTTLQKISQPGWDYVVLQAQSQEPSFSPTQVATDTYPYAKRLDSLIHIANTCAHTMFYMTWGRKYGDASNCAFYPPVCTFSGMNDRLRASYLEMGSTNYSRVSPVGVAWKNAWFADSSINLWSADNSHPSVAGTYLTACVFYAAIFKQSPIGAAYTSGLTAPQASFLQTIASQTVLDSLDTWMLNQDPIHAAFTDTIQQSGVQFYSNSYNANNFWWDFGDGIGYSVLENSGYYYGSTGSYQVELIASNGCYSDTAMALITINSIGLNENGSQIDWRILPNPAKDQIWIDGIEDLQNKSYQICNTEGKMVLSGMIMSNTIDVSKLIAGVYFLNINDQSKKLVITY